MCSPNSNYVFVGNIVDPDSLLVFLTAQRAFQRALVLESLQLPVFVAGLAEGHVLTSLYKHALGLLLARDAQD